VHGRTQVGVGAAHRVELRLIERPQRAVVERGGCLQALQADLVLDARQRHLTRRGTLQQDPRQPSAERGELARGAPALLVDAPLGAAARRGPAACRSAPAARRPARLRASAATRAAPMPANRFQTLLRPGHCAGGRRAMTPQSALPSRMGAEARRHLGQIHAASTIRCARLRVLASRSSPTRRTCRCGRGRDGHGRAVAGRAERPLLRTRPRRGGRVGGAVIRPRSGR
jgi:hypothetical protein